MSAEQAQPNKLTLVSSDNVSMDVARPVAERSLLIKNLLSDLPNEISEPIPIPNVRTRRLGLSHVTQLTLAL